MNSPQQNNFSGDPASRKAAGSKSVFVPSSAEETLRVIATLPAPDGLVDRVQLRLRAAPRKASVLRWPGALSPGAGWMNVAVMRGAAAAAIVCAVAGGAWEIYSRIPTIAQPSAKVVVMPARVGSSGGFSSAGAMRTPETLNGPVLTHAHPRPQPDVDKLGSTAGPETGRGPKPGKARKNTPPLPAHPAQ